MEQSSFRIDFAGITVDGGGAQDIALVDSWEMVTQFDTDGPDRASQSNQANNRLVISASGVYMVAFDMTVSLAGANKVFEKNVYEVSQTTVPITSATKADPVVITSAGHGFSNGNEVLILGSDMTELNGRLFKVADKAADTFELTDDGGTSPGDDIDGSGFVGAGTAVGTIQLATKLDVHSHRQYPTAGAIGYDGSIPYPVELTAGNFLYLFIMNVTDANNPTIDHCDLVMDWRG